MWEYLCSLKISVWKSEEWPGGEGDILLVGDDEGLGSGLGDWTLAPRLAWKSRS